MKKEELNALLQDMPLEEKVNQMLQIVGFIYLQNDSDILTGPARNMGLTKDNVDLAGSILGTFGADNLIKIQKNQMEKQPHHIPMLFMMDVIHGMKTIFPIPLGQGATFEPELSEKCAAVAAKEAAVSGLHVTFAPMVDLVRDARWGRVMESTGEDPYLNCLFAAAQVKGFQGEDMSEPFKVCSCVKHFAGYGGAQAGREYHTVDVGERSFKQYYLPSYKAGIDAGAGMVMTSFNTIDGVPATANKWLMREVLREEMGFDGVLISDFSAILETIAHGYCEDEKDAAKKALEAGVDIDMMTTVYAGNLCEMVKSGEIDEALIDESVLRILELKNKLGLFENPYKDANEELEKEVILCEEHRALAREAACKSFVLLKNDDILPIKKEQKIAFIGPYVSNKEIISMWAVTGDSKDCVTIEEAAKEVLDDKKVTFCKGTSVLSEEVEMFGFDQYYPEILTEEEKMHLLQVAITAAKEADIVIMPMGEHYLQSGEAASRADITVPENQMELFREIVKVNENIVVVLFNGRPLDIREISRKAKGILEVWIPGSEGGHAIMDVLTGAYNPSGKLTMSFPYAVGQVPVFYNELVTGRPFLPMHEDHFHSKYLDIPNTPLYPFGYGLSYTKFEISPIQLSTEKMTKETQILASVTVKNTGNVAGTEVVQLYIQDVTASVVRPKKELKRFEKVELKPGESQEVEFAIDETMLQFLRADGSWGSEPGNFNVWIGNSSDTENRTEFVLE